MDKLKVLEADENLKYTVKALAYLVGVDEVYDLAFSYAQEGYESNMTDEELIKQRCNGVVYENGNAFWQCECGVKIPYTDKQSFIDHIKKCRPAELTEEEFISRAN